MTVPDKKWMNPSRREALSLGILMLTGMPFAAFGTEPSKTPGGRIDYAKSAHVDSWLRHPVYGDPSFDSFKRFPGNPVDRGTPEFSWPVNGFLFLDPRSGNWYIYVGDYKTGYGGGKSRCLLYRSVNRGKSWVNLGPVVQGDPQMFDRNGHTPDASVVYDRGRYHMVYDWGEPDFGGEGGLAYAWADRPEGPWHRAAEPITRNTTLSKLLGKYQRTYAATLIRRHDDWMILGMMDSAPQSWTLFAMTAAQPQGPYSERRLIRHVESDYFHPPLMEYYPAFAHAGWVYAAATSVALNRNFNALFRAPLERATDPSAWEILRHGSLWHAEDVENETHGIWGQTFSGQVTSDGRLLAMFNSRDPQNLGTVNMAERPWASPLRKQGFHFSGNDGPSFTCLNRSYGAFVCRADLHVRGTARILWGYQGAIGPDRPGSDASLHPMTLTRHAGLELSDAGWKVVAADPEGKLRVLGEGNSGRDPWHIAVERTDNGQTSVRLDDTEVWRGVSTDTIGPVGLLALPNTVLEVTRFELEGESQPAHLHYLYTEGLLGAGEKAESWQEQQGANYRFGLGAVHRGPGGMAKWNFFGTGVRLWSPTAPELGNVQVTVDGKDATVVDLHSGSQQGPVMIWEKQGLTAGFHCLVMRAQSGVMALDGVEVIS